MVEKYLICKEMAELLPCTSCSWMASTNFNFIYSKPSRSFSDPVWEVQVDVLNLLLQRTGVNILHKICNCSEADCNCSGALQRNFFADNWKGFIAFCWNCYFYHTWFRFLLLSKLKSGNSNRFVWKLLINTFIFDFLCKVKFLADVLASKLLSISLQDS